MKTVIHTLFIFCILAFTGSCNKDEPGDTFDNGNNRVSVFGEYSGFYDFPEDFFRQSNISNEQLVKVTDAIFLSLKEMHNGISPYDFTKIVCDEGTKMYVWHTTAGLEFGDFGFPGYNNGHLCWQRMAYSQGLYFFEGTSGFFKELNHLTWFLRGSMAAISSYYSYRNILNNPDTYGIEDLTRESLDVDFLEALEYEEMLYENYVSMGKNFDVEKESTSAALTVKMFEFGEAYGWDHFKKLARAFEDGISDRIIFKNGIITDTDRSTFIIAALSASFELDLRQEFYDLSFPIDEDLYQSIYPAIHDYINMLEQQNKNAPIY